MATPSPPVTADASPGPRKSADSGRDACTVTPETGTPSLVERTTMEVRAAGDATGRAAVVTVTPGSPVSAVSPSDTATGFFPGNAKSAPAPDSALPTTKFEHALLQPGFPRFEVRWRRTGKRLRLDLRQVQPEAWGTWRLPALEIDVAGRRLRVDGTAREAYVTLDGVRGDPKAIRVDPDGWWLMEATVVPAQ